MPVGVLGRAARLGRPVARAQPAALRAPQPRAGDRRPWACSSGLCATAYQLTTGRAVRRGAVLRAERAARARGRARPATPSACSCCSVCSKAVAYGLSLRAFRGGPVFPAMFIGAVLGIAVSGLPGMELAAAIGTGIGAMCCAMLRLPLTSVLLATLLMGTDGLTVIPQVIVAVVVSFVVTAVLPVRRRAEEASPDDRATRTPQRDRRLALHGRVGVLRARFGAGLPQRRSVGGSTASRTSSGRSSSPAPPTASSSRRRPRR